MRPRLIDKTRNFTSDVRRIQTRREDRPSTSDVRRIQTRREDRASTSDVRRIQTHEEDRTSTSDVRRIQTRREDRTSTSDVRRIQTRREDRASTSGVRKIQTCREDRTSTSDVRRIQTRREDRTSTSGEMRPRLIDKTRTFTSGETRPGSDDEAGTSTLGETRPGSDDEAGTSTSGSDDEAGTSTLDSWPSSIKLAAVKEMNHGEEVKDQSLKVKVIKSFKNFKCKYRNTDKSIFYAILADDSDFIIAKVIDRKGKKDFSKGASIIFTNFKYWNGILEMTEYTKLEKLTGPPVEVPMKIREKAKKGILLEEVKKLPLETIVSGLFNVNKWRKVKNGYILTAEDETGKMDIAIFNQVDQIILKDNKKMHFLGFKVDMFEPNQYEKKLQLKSTSQSFVQ
ncbi:uncharacterized protein LOC102356144 [Latimeria chalumnae]|uniref:uncharacterized protein LOC102356144 n=1 Tax=Latimeria chalumnae TaxID=7897 RepID=UPI00313DFB41